MKRSMDYRHAAGKYDRRYNEISFDGTERVLLTFIGSNSANRVLEVGCGTGHWLAFLESHGYSVSGMDPSPQMLEQARDFELIYSDSDDAIFRYLGGAGGS